MNPILLLGIGGGIVFVLLLIGIVVSMRADSALIEERMDQIAGTEQDVFEIKGSDARPLTDWINTRVEGTSFAGRISKNLARADIKMKTGEYIALILISVFGVGLVAWFVGGRGAQGIVLGIVGAIAGFFLPSFYVKRQQSKRLQKFDEQLSDMLSLMVNGLRAGYSTMQAMEAVSRELPPPICDEFRRVVQEMQLGVSMEKTLENLVRRIPSQDLDFVITALNVQREVGGNLAEILDTISFTIRERVRIKGEIRVLTTQVMYSGRFLSLMPVILLGALYVMNRPYMMEFFTNPPCGYIALALAAILIAAGYFAMNKLADIEI
ncbi:MAG: type II secretion system F family protein [Anaerolineaceae bacterium]|nr:type II secretion system F family protein [Anaerolineaceae bacterium]